MHLTFLCGGRQDGKKCLVALFNWKAVQHMSVHTALTDSLNCVDVITTTIILWSKHFIHIFEQEFSSISHNFSYGVFLFQAKFMMLSYSFHAKNYIFKILNISDVFTAPLLFLPTFSL